ncbi:hypothetical protein LUX33_24565 [Actinomadura madurae]|nr:hypothetical protein [Actinomadura madurae]MCP9951280.1 hypothetical protein [Actinomadura madurae]
MSSAASTAATSAARPTKVVRPGGQPEESPGTGLLRPRGQGVPVGGIELAQQRRDVALDRPDRDAQPAGDLRVRQVLAHGGEHLGLPCRDLRRVHIDQDGVRR